MPKRFDDDVDFFDPPNFIRTLSERDTPSIPNRLPAAERPVSRPTIVSDRRLNSLFVLPLAEDSMIESPPRQDVVEPFRPMAPLPGPVRPSIPPKAIIDWPRSQDRRRSFPPGSGAWPSNVYGASAQVFGAQQRKWAHGSLPCIDRQVRREVMFAKRKAGRGHRVPHRRSWISNIGC